MRTALVGILAFAACEKPAPPPPEPKFLVSDVCVKSETVNQQVCQTDTDDAGVGCVAGLLVAGPLGCVAGAVIGKGDNKTTCHEEKRSVCVETKTVLTPNPNYKEPQPQ